MTILADVLDAMVAAGCTAKQIAAAVRADEKAQEEKRARKREQNRIRQQNHRARNASHALSQRDTPNGLEGSTPPKTLNPQSPSSLRSSGDARVREEFNDNFWPAYPHKVGKPDALKAWMRARHRAPLDRIMDGLRAYQAKRDDRPWCNPSTWLNQDRWNDQPAVVKARGPPYPTSDDMLAALQRRLDDDDDTNGDHAGHHQGADYPLLGLAAQGHKRE